MDSTFGFILLGCFAVAILKGVVRSVKNPISAVEYSSLPAEFQAEIARVLPDFTPQETHLTKNSDTAKVVGQSAGRTIRIEGEFDAHGSMIEFDLEAPGGMHSKERSTREDLPARAEAEIERLLGDPSPVFDRTRVSAGTINEEPHFEFKGYASDWKWEIVVSADGQLHELEREARRARH